MKNLINNQPATLGQLMLSKAIISCRDGRFGTIIEFGDEYAVVELERMGTRKFPLDTIKNGFIPLMSDEEIIIEIVARSYDPIKATDEEVYALMDAVYNVSKRRYNFSYETIYKTLRLYFED